MLRDPARDSGCPCAYPPLPADHHGAVVREVPRSAKHEGKVIVDQLFCSIVIHIDPIQTSRGIALGLSVAAQTNRDQTQGVPHLVAGKLSLNIIMVTNEGIL